MGEVRQVDIAVDKQRRDKHIRQVVNHQVQYRAIEAWQHGLHIDPPRQRPVHAIHNQRQAQPQQAGLGLVLQQRQRRKEGQHHAGGGKAMGAPGFESGYMQGRYHRGVLQKVKRGSRRRLSVESGQGMQVSTGKEGIRFTTKALG